jgi:hypothetical protein
LNFHLCDGIRLSEEDKFFFFGLIIRYIDFDWMVILLHSTIGYYTSCLVGENNFYEEWILEKLGHYDAQREKIKLGISSIFVEFDLSGQRNYESWKSETLITQLFNEDANVIIFAWGN